MTIDILYAHSDAMCHRVFEYVKIDNGILLHWYVNVEIYLQQNWREGYREEHTS